MLLSGCGSGESGDEGFVAVGAAGPSDRGAADGRTPPKDGVTLVPLDEQERGEPPENDGAPPPDDEPPRSEPPPAPSQSAPEPPQRRDSPEEGTDSGDADEEHSGPSAEPAGPAALKVGKPENAKAGERWCQKVTVTFRNTGGEPVEAGKVVFATHVIGALGTDWDTLRSKRKLPVPLRAGEKKEKSWTLCVDEWRVPLGMHLETRSVKVEDWKS